MHILVVGRTLPNGKNSAYGVFEFEQAKQLNKKVKTGFLFINNSSLKSQRKMKSINVNVHDVNVIGTYLPIKGLPRSIYDKIRAKLFIRAFNNYISINGTPDIIHIHFPLLILNRSIINFLRDRNIKIVMTEHWSKIQYRSLSKKQIVLLKKLVDKADAFVTVSEELKNSTIHYTEKTNTITVIPNMVDDGFYKIPLYDSNKKIEKFVFTFIGRLVKAKRVDFLIDAFKDAFGNKKDVELKIIGDGPLMNKLKRQSTNTDNIFFTGNLNRNELAKELSISTAFVTASNFETFGVPVIEAMSLGIPVICSKEIPVSNYINNSNGFLFDPNNKSDLSMKLRKMYSHIDNFSSEVIRSESYNIFSSNAVTNMLIDTYKEII